MTPAHVAALITEDAARIEHAAPSAELRGRERSSGQIAAYMRAVPDCGLEAVRVSVEGDRRILEWRSPGCTPASCRTLRRAECGSSWPASASVRWTTS